MTKQLTKEMAKKYFENNQAICPFCESDIIDAGHVDVDVYGATGSVTCADCGESWNDIYAFEGIANEDYSITFEKEPAIWLSVEDVYYTEYGAGTFEVNLLKDGVSDGAFLYRSEFDTEDMTGEDYDNFIKRIEKTAEEWGARLSIGFKKEDYFDD